MSGFRKNTLVVDFSVLPSRPEVGKVQQFLEHEIKLNLSDVKGVQFHNTRKCVYIEMVDSNTAQRYVNAHNIKRLFACKGKLFKIPMFVDSETVSVRVHECVCTIHHGGHDGHDAVRRCAFGAKRTLAVLLSRIAERSSSAANENKASHSVLPHDRK